MSAGEQSFVTVDLQRLLWRTRGRTWDYCFVLQPVQLHINSFYQLHFEAFSGTKPEATPRTWGGVLIGEESKLRFVATLFLDEDKVDTYDRPIAHYMVWFPTPGADADLRLPADWGAHLLRAFGEEWTSAYSSNGGADDDRLFDACAKINSVTVPHRERVVLLRFDRQVLEKKKRRPRQRSPWTTTALSVGIALVLLFLILLWLGGR